MEILILMLMITQIIIESLPISSSGHVALLEMLLKKLWKIKIILPDFIDNLLHSTALLAISVIFFKDWFFPTKKLLHACIQVTFSKKPLTFAQKKLFIIFFKIIGLVFVANLVTSIFYFSIKFFLKDYLFINTIFLLVGFIITMILLLSLKFRKQNQIETLNLKKTLILGCIQGLAVLPGISRFASTYVAGCWLNLQPARAMQISFLLHLPLIIAAFLFMGLKPLIARPEVLNKLNFCNLAIILLSAAIAVFLLNLCYKLAIKNKLWWFGIYMLIPILMLIYLK